MTGRPVDIILNIPSRIAPVNGRKGDARHTFGGQAADDLKAIFAQPLTADEAWKAFLAKQTGKGRT